MRLLSLFLLLCSFMNGLVEMFIVYESCELFVTSFSMRLRE